MPEPNRLRYVAAQMFALSMTTRDEDFARRLALRASRTMKHASVSSAVHGGGKRRGDSVMGYAARGPNAFRPNPLPLHVADVPDCYRPWRTITAGPPRAG